MVLGSLDENRWLLGLARVRAALDRLGHPERQYKLILVGGTNGKGSTCIYLERILLTKGLKVGTTLSPHVRRYLERFRIDGHDVCEEELARNEDELRNILGDIGLTYFEWAVVLACVLFARNAVDFAIFEIGLGGRLDAANVLEPCISIITNIALDHTDYLGPTIADIAREKAAIARPGRYLITSAVEGLDVIRAHARQIGARLKVVCEPLPHATGIPGPSQGLNAALALKAAISLGVHTTETELTYALASAFLPGRIEILGPVILDVAHNPASMLSLVEYLAQRDFDGLAVLGVLKDKDYMAMTKILKEVCRALWIAPVSSPRSWGEEGMQKAQALGGITRCVSITEAFHQTLQYGTHVVVTGSFYTVGEVRDLIICQG